jgi:hypothetical protein
MFGEHYGSLLISSGALVELKNELQSVYMSTKLNQFGLTWNLSNNLKFVKNQSKLQLQKLFQIIPSSSMNFLRSFSIYSYFMKLFSFKNVLNQLEKNSAAGSHLSASSLPPGPTCQRSFGTSDATASSPREAPPLPSASAAAIAHRLTVCSPRAGRRHRATQSPLSYLISAAQCCC